MPVYFIPKNVTLSLAAQSSLSMYSKGINVYNFSLYIQVFFIIILCFHGNVYLRYQPAPLLFNLYVGVFPAPEYTKLSV